MRTIGVEREWFILKNGQITPEIGKLLPQIYANIGNGFSREQFGFELFAGQIEDRSVVAKSLKELINSLLSNEEFMRAEAEKLGLSLICMDFVEEQDLGQLEVNPFDERHQKIWANIPTERRVAASQVAAIHVHISVSRYEAYKILNVCRLNTINRLIQLGDFSQGKRIAAYRKMAETSGEPPIFRSTNHLMEYISGKGGERNVWDLVRYKPSTGTIEFRMFGATHDPHKISEFVIACMEIVER